MNFISRLTARFLAWHLKPTDTQNYDVLDGLRGLAILLVIACHLVYFNPDANVYIKFIGGICGAGGYGVTLFFCLSGYLVSLPFWKRKRLSKTPVIPPGYGQRRFFKIYPPLVFSLLLLTPIYIYFSHDPSYLIPTVEWLFGIPILGPVDGRLNPVMWSLIVEVQFYMLLPVVMLLFRNISMRKSIWMIPLLFASVGICSRYAFMTWGIYGTIFPWVYRPLFSDLDVFTMGVFVAGLHSMGFITKSWAKIGNIGALIFIVTLPILSYLNLIQQKSLLQSEIVSFILKIAFGCMLFFIADAKRFATQLFCNPLLRWFGIISYEWYLLHQPIFYWIRHSLSPGNGSISTYLFIISVSFMTSLLLAALVYKYFSLPILEYGRIRYRPIDK